MQEHIKRIRAILEQFAREEVGNKLSNFSILALISSVNFELEQLMIQELKQEKTEE